MDAFRLNIILLLNLLLLSVFSSYGQTDVEFWFVAPEITIGHPSNPLDNGGEPVYFRVTALDLDATVTIEQPENSAGIDTTFNVPANTTVSIDATPWIDEMENKPGGIVLNKGIHITSTNLITVYYDEDEFYNQDVFALKGRNALGTEFYTPFNDLWANGTYAPLPYCSIDIVATKDNTVIDITPTADIVGGHSAGNTFTINLDRGETYSCVATSQSAAGHLGGTHITSNNPIAVTIKDDSVIGNPCKDLIGDQTVPIINADGKQIVGFEYIVMRGKINLPDPTSTTYTYPDGDGSGERIFIMATEPNTTVDIDGVFFATINNPGEQVSYEIENNSHHVEGDKPIMILHVSGFGCEFGGAVLPTIDGCTGSLEVSFTRSTDRDFYLNIMTIDAAKDAFTMHYEDGSTYAIPGGWFEPVGTSGFATLKKDRKLFVNDTDGGVPQGEVTKVTNSLGVFHLGLIEGGRTTGCKYGYFSDYSVSRGGVVVVETGSKSIFRCYGDTVQLRADGGLTYSWSPSSYLDDPFIATPKAAPPPGIYNYDVTLTRACFPDTTFSVIVGISDQVEAFFDMDEWYICSPDTVTFENQSSGVDMSSITNVKWDFDLADPVNPPVYDTSSVFQREFTNTTDSVETKTVQLTVWNSQSCASEFRRDIIVRPEIKAGFTNDASAGCHPLTVNFTNTSTGNTDRFKWTLGDGSSAITTDVSHNYINHGMTDQTLDVEMVAISPFFCSDTFNTSISVYPYLEAAFAIDTFHGCSPLIISIDNISAGYIEEYEWTFDDGSGSLSTPAATLSHTYTNTTVTPSLHNLRLVVKNNTRGCTDTIIKVISVYPEVSSAFTQDNTSGCHGIVVNFTNQSTAAATLFEWDFGDGGSSSSQNALHTFENMELVNADYSVRLVSTTPNLCRDTSYQTIQVHPYIHSEFSVDEFQGCAPFTVVLQNAAEGAISSYDWDWGDGSPSSVSGAPIQTHPYQNTGPAAVVNYLTLIVENADGCADTMIRNITVFPEVTSQFTQDKITGCNQLQVGFTNQSSASATSFLWEFGDGGSSDQVNPGHLFHNFVIRDTTFTSRLISVTDEDCRDTSQVDITVYSYVDADFTFSQGTACTPFDVTFNNSSVGGISYNWDFGDGSDTTVSNNNPVIHRFSNPSTTTPVTNQVVLTVLNSQNCPSSKTKDINVQPVVVSAFTADIAEGCHPLNVNFTNSSTGAIVYNWDFTNGQTSNQSDPSTLFVNFGLNDTTYNVRLMATNVQTCRDSFFVPILVHPFVDADFAIEYVSQCSPASVNFNNLSVNGQQYDWTFDGTPHVTTSTLPINRQFTNSSTNATENYQIDLTVTSPQGCTSYLSRKVDVFHRIEASYSSITEGCHPLDVAFTNNSVGALDHKWVFGDNTSSILLGPSHTYNNEGNQNSIFDVMLTVVSENYCKDSLSSQITVYPGPKAKFTVNKTVDCSPLNIVIQNTSETGDSYTWDFGDGSDILNTTSTNPVIHSYTNDQAGVQLHQLKLDVQTNFGCSEFITKNITVFPSVDVDFERDSAGCSPFYSKFINKSQRSSTYEWDFSDGTASYVDEPSHTFVNNQQTQKTFNVELKGYSEYGCVDSVIRQVNVYPSPVAEFSYAPIYQYFPSSSITLINETNTGSWDFLWDFDDGNTSTTQDPGSYIYGDWGEYSIQLNVTNGKCNDSVIHWVEIFAPLPIAAFEPDADTGCVPLVVAFTNNSVYGDEYLWEFDDGGTSKAFEPNHTFNTAGYYQVKLIVKGEGGEDFAFHEIQIYVLPIADFIVEPSLVMLPDQPAKVFNFSKYGDSYLWDFGDGTNYTTKDTTHQYTELGVYDISLTTWTEHGCEASLYLPQAVTVEGAGIMEYPTVFAPSSSGPSDGSYNPNDPSNEIFFPVYDGVIEYELVIYNRWGEVVFRSEDVNKGWDGYCGSIRCVEAVYVWQVRVTYTNGTKEVLVGDITLLYRPD
jgi:PKD repeat protein